MGYMEHEKALFGAAEAGDWEKAIHHATMLPPSHDPWQRLPSAAPLNDFAVNKILDILSNPHHPHGRDTHNNRASFLFELLHNMPGVNQWEKAPALSQETLNRIGDHVKDSGHESQLLLNHPHYKPTDHTQSLANAGGFWHEYERQVGPHHFATIKSIYTGKPETMKDHRGQLGSSEKHMHLIPDLITHSKKVQDAVLNDPHMIKRNFNGKPHVQLWRGVNGHYGKLIRDRANYDSDTNQADNRRFIIPTAHLTSWTANPEVARRFVWYRDQISNQPTNQGVVMSQWVPVSQILHSGHHKTSIHQTHAHPQEEEIVVGHPKGQFRISTANMEFQAEPKMEEKGYGGSSIATNHGQTNFPMLRKTEFDNDYVYIFPEKTGSPAEENVVSLHKNMRKFVSAATALALLGAPQDSEMKMPSSNMPKEVQQFTSPEPVQSLQPEPASPFPGLKPIKMIESSGGLDTKHRTMTQGPHSGTRAFGSYGLMPMTIMEVLNKNPALMRKYPDFQGLDFQRDHDKIHGLMKQHPHAEVDIANTHWNRLRNVFANDKSKMAYAWLNGVAGTMRASDKDIHANPYVQKYKKYRQMIDLEKKFNLKKSEALQRPVGIEKFIPFMDVVQNHKAVRDINDAIETGQLHNLSNVGKFTHESFVAGFDPQNSWLIKLEPHGKRPAVESAKYGLQTIKEAAFYYLANRVFNMGEFTPKAILGEIIKDGEHQPAVAIRMYPQVFIAAHDLEEQSPGAVKKMLEPHRKSGELHKLAAMLYILGDADSHGNNLLTDGYDLKVIDHGTSFADIHFDPEKDDNVFIPYFMRIWGIKDNMSPEEKFMAMPEIDNDEVRRNVNHWLQALNHGELEEITKKFNIDPAPAMKRLDLLQKLARNESVDLAINSVWTKGTEAANENN